MERSFSLKGSTVRALFLLLFFLLFQSFGFSQNLVQDPLLRFPVWYVIEESPDKADTIELSDSQFATAREGIQHLAPYFIEGLVYGWEFSYTPSDRVRGVSEFFEMKRILTISENDANIRLTNPVVMSNLSVVEAWVEYDLSNRMMHERLRWHSGSFPSIGGRGEALVFDGVESVKTACENAAKSAIRQYSQNIIKNKPKEINGKILLTDFPRYYIDAGKYVADLDFFLNVSTIVEYTKF